MEEINVINPHTPAVQPKTVWGGWGTTPAAVPCSLGDVMSQELALELQVRDETASSTPLSLDPDDLSSFVIPESCDTSSDLLIAQMVQLQMDEEHDRQLKREEAKWNGTSKVKISFDKYRTVHPVLQEDLDLEDMSQEVEEIKDKKDAVPCFNRFGIAGKGKNIVTKHDPVICGRKNATKVMETFPPEFETGDGVTYSMSIPNKVYNKLKIYSNVESKRAQRNHEKKEHSTIELAVDEKTRLIMYKLVNAGALNSVTGVVSSGKESIVFHADGGSILNQVVPAECALKVFKTTLSEFKNRFQYVCGDVRFFKDEFKKKNPRKIMKIWAEKEEMNLRRMEKFHIPCPTVVVLKKHILVMSFLGENRIPAPTLKDAKLSTVDIQIAYEQCLQNMKTMFHSCRLVHADLSEYNMLWFHDKVYFIDVAQAVDAMHPHAMEFLLRDCTNVSEFFTRSGAVGVLSPHELFNSITELNLTGEGKDFLAQIEKYEKDEENLRLGMSKTDYPFDFFFAKACAERDLQKELRSEHQDDDSHSDAEDDDDDAEDDEDAEEEDDDAEEDEDAEKEEEDAEKEVAADGDDDKSPKDNAADLKSL